MDDQGSRDDACGTHEEGSQCWGFKDLRRAHCWTCTFGHIMLYSGLSTVRRGGAFVRGSISAGHIMLYEAARLCFNVLTAKLRSALLGQVMPSRTHRPDLL